MSIITRAQCADYDSGFEANFGKQCFYCRKRLEPGTPEIENGYHAACDPDVKFNGSAQEAKK